ncbi:MAG: DUF4157 domain-containing protein [Sphingomonas sp.]
MTQQMSQHRTQARAETADKPAQRAPKKKLAQLALKKKPAQLAPKKKLAQLASKKKPLQMAVKKKPVQRAANGTGLPDAIKSGVEALSGMSMDHVRVHHNSPKPAQLNAHAYAQGSDIHVAPGQAHHLPHEAWHVVQQARGQVRPTLQMAQGVAVNDDRHLEREADVMGARAMQIGSIGGTAQLTAITAPTGGAVVQRAVPTGTGLPKPVPQTSNYTARNDAKDIIFDQKTYTRSKFSFGVYTRGAVLAEHNPTGIGHHASTVMTSTGHQVNTQAVQLDHHPQSWDRIADAMQRHNAQLKAHGVPITSNDYYTLWDARMYYNDVTNLRPAMGSDNASGGADGVTVAAPMHEFLRGSLGNAVHAMTNLQHVLGAFHETFQEDQLHDVVGMLGDLANHANQVSDRVQNL